jgi:deoxyribonuclease-4
LTFLKKKRFFLRFGFHISIAGGFSKVVERAEESQCETIQLFSRNPRGWHYKDLDCSDVKQFKTKLKASRISPCFLHLPYLPNLAAAKKELYEKSIDSLCEDLRRAEILGIPFLVTHVGSKVTLSEGEAIKKMVKALNQSLKRVPNRVIILLENTAGQGTELGSNFSQMAQILSGINDKGRVGVCLDTAHAFQAGYNLSSEGGLNEALNEFDRSIGLHNLYLIHLNDSKSPLGSHADRHWHIGQGYIGKEGFGNIVNHHQLNHLPGIMETPRKDLKDDLRNMRVIRSLIKK